MSASWRQRRWQTHQPLRNRLCLVVQRRVFVFSSNNLPYLFDCQPPLIVTSGWEPLQCRYALTFLHHRALAVHSYIIWCFKCIYNKKINIVWRRNPFTAENQTLKSKQNIYFAYQLGIHSSYSGRIVSIFNFAEIIPSLNQRRKQAINTVYRKESFPSKESDILHYRVEQGWAISGPRATCVPPQRFLWPAEAFRKNLKI